MHTTTGHNPMTADKERPYSVFAGAGETELSAVEGASSGACPLAPAAGAGEPRAAKTSFARVPNGERAMKGKAPADGAGWCSCWVPGLEQSPNLSKVDRSALTRRRPCPPPCPCPWPRARLFHTG
uniref:cDNA FLJ59183 n=1 Tax=Homo sapiens TaxID=9606 RepID=B4DEN8_HUMAN|nr:unnamed protein product [Homo sapiens]